MNKPSLASAAVACATAFWTSCVSDGATIGTGTSATCDAIEPGALCTTSNGADQGYCIHPGQAVDLLRLADDDGDGVLTFEELEPYLGLLFSGDLDLDRRYSECDPATGLCGDGVTACVTNANCEDACSAAEVPAPACRGVFDAASFGMRFTAVGASVEGI